MASNFLNNMFLFIKTNQNRVLGALVATTAAASILNLLGGGFLFTAIAFIGILTLGWLASTATQMYKITPANSTQREREFNSVIDHIHEGVILYDRDFTILKFNETAEKIFGVPADKVVGKRLSPSSIKEPGFSSLAQIIFPSLAPRVKQLSETGTWPQISSITLEKPTRELTATLHPVADAAGNITSFLKLVEDKTEQERAAASTNDFVSVAAHQLRTPLTAIKWSLESIATAVKNDTEEVRDLIAKTRELAERALKTANDLLDLTKFEEGKAEYHFSEVDIFALMQKILQIVAPIAKSRGVSVFLTPPSSPPQEITADEVRIGDVIMNILDNAIRYNVQGGKVIITFEELTAQKSIKISVEDTGIGIPDNEREKIFGKLQRASNAIQMEPNGNGLGLYIAKEVIVAHGGSIGISSALNRGTTVWFTLPLQGNH